MDHEWVIIAANKEVCFGCERLRDLELNPEPKQSISLGPRIGFRREDPCVGIPWSMRDAVFVLEPKGRIIGLFLNRDP